MGTFEWLVIHAPADRGKSRFLNPLPPGRHDWMAVSTLIGSVDRRCHFPMVLTIAMIPAFKASGSSDQQRIISRRSTGKPGDKLGCPSS